MAAGCPLQFGMQQKGLVPQRAPCRQGDASAPAPRESAAAPGLRPPAQEGKGELEVGGGQIPGTGAGRVEGGECINRK